MKSPGASFRGSTLSRLLLEGRDAEADIILGLDQNMAGRALARQLTPAARRL
jgi:ABC-type thiamine transport system substrate-binding protein